MRAGGTSLKTSTGTDLFTALKNRGVSPRQQAMTEGHRSTNAIPTTGEDQMQLKCSVDMKPSTLLRAIADHLEMEPIIPVAIATASTPRLGQYWQDQGGIFVGTMRGEDGLPDYHLIVGVGDGAEFRDVKWGERGKGISGATHDRDGMANTIAMGDSSCQLALDILSLEHEGHRDWYLPSRQELALCWMNTDDVFAKTWHWSSSQSSAYSAFYQGFVDGRQDYAAKNHRFRARAVRRVVIQ